jgi:hypothetical protein
MTLKRGIVSKLLERRILPALLFSVALALPAQNPAAIDRYLSGHFPDKPSPPPTASIPVEPLGFSAPGAIYLGSRNTLASLDFLDENHLLFTFRIPGLLHRDLSNGEDSDERRIRALVLELPGGAVEAQTTWTVHDRVRYLWPLNGGRFLLRDRNTLLAGDATLQLKPLFDFPGPLLSVELDPAQQYLVVNSSEPVAAQSKSADRPGATGQIGSPTTAADVTDDYDSPAPPREPDLLVRILRRSTGEVLLVSRIRAAVHLPINSTGYLENLRSRDAQWILNLDYFTGGTKFLGAVESQCSPDDNFLSEQLILAIGCGPYGESRLAAVTTAGRTLWQAQTAASEVWPQLAVSANGLRLAVSTLDINHNINSFNPIGAEDVKEQSVAVFDAATGAIVMVSPLSPILDAGGNVALSPSGSRVALVNAGAIQIFDLPAPPALPADTPNSPAR